MAFGVTLISSSAMAQQGYANLSISFSESANGMTLGQYFTATLTVNNAGWETGTNTVVTNTLPANLELIGLKCSRGDYVQSPGLLVWNLGDLPPYSAPATLKLEFKTIATGDFTNRATIVSAAPDADLGDNQTSLSTTVTRAKFFGVGNTRVGFYNRPSLALLTNNQVLVVGQHLGNTSDVYSVSSRSFSLTNGLTVGAHETGTLTPLTNGLVLVAGGLNATGAKIAEVYNPGTKLFRRVGDMLVYCYDHRATLQPDGMVLLCGGTLTTNAVFNPVTETFSVAPPGLSCPPAGIRLPDGRYFQGSGGASIFDPVTGTSTATDPMNYFRFSWSSTLIPPDKVLIAGGDRNSSTAELYDIPSGRFSILPNLNLARSSHSAILLPDGTVLIVGGMNNQYLQGNTYTEVFDPGGLVDVPGIGVSDAAVVEGSSGSNFLQFTVWLTTNSALPVTVNFATATGSAGSSAWGLGTFDFVGTNGTLTIPAGQTNATIRVAVVPDQIKEPDENLTLVLSQPIQAWMARAVAQGTILNDDAAPTVSIFPVKPTVTEKDSGVDNLVFNVTLSAESFDLITMDYFTSNGTAQAGSDYFGITGTLTYQPGETNKTLTVTSIGDLQPEPDETFTLNLTNAPAALINIAQATGAILNDDGFSNAVHHFEIAPIIGLKSQTVAFPVTITARDGLGNPVTNYSGPLQVSAISPYATATNLDFEQATLAPWTPAPPAENPGPYELVQYDVDGDGRPSTAFRLRINYGTDGIIQNVSLRGGITYRFSTKLVSAQEGGGCWVGAQAALQIANSNAYWNMPDLCGGQSARQTIALDYTAPTNGLYPLSVTVGWGSIWWETPAADYFLYVDDLQVSCPVITPPLLTNGFVNGVWSGMVTALQAATNASLKADDTQGHFGISNPFDIQPVADLVLSGSSLVQGTPPLRTGMKLQFNLALTNRGPATVNDALVTAPIPTNLTFLTATNLQGSISANSNLVTWSIGRLPPRTNLTVSLVYCADTPGDFTNQFFVSATTLEQNPSDNILAVSNHIDPPLLAIGDASGTEAFSSTTGLVFALTLSGPSSQTVAVSYYTANGTATSNLDFIPTNGVVTFPPGTTNRSLIVFALDDILDEPNRTFTVQLTNAINAVISDNSGAGTLLDDDLPPVIDIADTNILEGDLGTKSAVFKLTLSKLAIVDVTVRCTTSPGTAVTNDFIQTTSDLTFPAGSTNASFAVPILGNTVNESNETFTVTLSLPTNATIGRATATGTILNDDAVAGRLNHFVWDAVASPRFNNAPFPVTLRAVDYLGNPATNTGLAAVVTAHTENGYLGRLQEDFEDGDSIGWTNYITAFSSVVTNETAASGSNSLRLTGSTANTAAGLRTSFTTSQPNRLVFAVRTGKTNQISGRFSATANGLYRSAVFYFNNNGQMGLLDRSLGFRGVPYQSNRWYQIDLTLNWAAQKADCRIDGVLVLTNITFPDSTAISMDAITLANQDNTTTWWDDIRVCNDNLTNSFTVTPSNFVSFVSAAKSNLVSIAGYATNTWLYADDGAEHVGSSSYFNLLQVPLSLTVTSSVTEGSAPVTAWASIPVPFPQPITVALTSTIPARVSVPTSIIIPANQTNTTFSLSVVDDALLNGTELGAVIASVTNFISATSIIAVQDNERAILTLALPTSATENAGTLTSQGQVTASAPPSRPIAITLRSSDTNVVQVPATVTILSNQISATFDLTIVNNSHLDGPHAATISTTVVNMTNDSRTITIADDENTNLRLSPPVFVSEGSSAPVSVHLTGILATNVTLNLSSGNTNALVTPSVCTVLAGQTSAAFTVTAPDNALFDSTRIVSLTVTGPGFTSAVTNLTVMDNDLHHFAFGPIASPQQGSVGFNVTLTAQDISNVMVVSNNSSIALSALDGLNNSVQITPTSIALTNGQWTGTVTIPNWEFQNVRITASNGGISNTSSAFNIVAPTLSLLNLAANDLVYSGTTKRLYASVTSAGVLTEINPFTATVGASVAIANLTGRLCGSDGGQYVFAALNGAINRLCQFSVNSQSVINAWDLEGYYVEDMAFVPGSPDAVAVSRRIFGGSPHTRGIVVYDTNGVRTNAYPLNGSNVIEPGRSAGCLYGYNNETTSFGFSIMNVAPAGISSTGGWAGLEGFGVDIASRGGRIFATTGAVFDSERGLPLGSYGGQVADDAASGRYYLLVPGLLTAYDEHTLLPVGSTSVTGLTATAGSFIRWGTNGFAVRVSSSQLALIRSPLVASGATNDLRVSLQPIAMPVPVNSMLSYTLMISNQGPTAAQWVVLTQTIPANSIFLSASNPAGTNAMINGGIVSTWPAIPSGGVVSITVNLQALKPGLLAALASVTSDSVDSNLSNNVVRLRFPVAAPPSRDSITEMLLPSGEIRWNSNRSRIIASVPNSDWLLGNTLTSFDPATGMFDDPIAVGIDPQTLALSSEGRYAYTGLYREGAIQRVDLQLQASEPKFPVARYNAASYLEVQPDNPEVLAASGPDVVVYQSGQVLPFQVERGPYSFPFPIKFGATTSRLYATTVDTFRRITISTNGAILIENVGGLISGFDTSFGFDAGRVFTGSGRVFDPEAKVMIGTVPYSGLVLPDASSGRTFYLQGSGAIYNLIALNFTNLQFVGTVNITNVSGTPTSLIRWGTDGLAFRTTGGQVFLIRTKLADDRDNDGLPDSWELTYYNNIYSYEPSSDPDADGVNNLNEYLNGSSPMLAEGFNLGEPTLLTNGAFRFRFVGPVNGHYRAQYRTNLNFGTWTTLQDFTNLGGTTVILDTNAPLNLQRFYRGAPMP